MGKEALLYSVGNKQAASFNFSTENTAFLNRQKLPAEEERLLVEQVKAGNHQAFEAIFRLHSAKVFQVAYKLLADRAETEDAVQEVFLAVYQKAKTFRWESQFSTWLHRLTVNAALSRLRQRKRSKEVLYDDYLPKYQKDGHHLVRPVVDWSEEFDDRSAREDLRQLLEQALSQLRPTDKAVVVLSDLEGLSDREVGKALGLTVSAVKTRLHRSRLFLRGKLAVHLGHSPA